MLPLILMACAPPEQGVLINDVPPVEDQDPAPTGLLPPQPSSLRGFSWVVDGMLAAMPYPRDLDAIGAEGVETLVTLTVSPLDPTSLESAGLTSIHLPVADFTAPTLQQITTFVEAVEEAEATGTPLGVHCAAGLGRTGTMSAAWFVYQGMTAQEALYHIRELRPGSVETLSQEEILSTFEASLAR